MKIIEKSGTQLARSFQRVNLPKSCHLSECTVCLYSDGKKSACCRVTNVVHEAVCLECEDTQKESTAQGMISEKKS